MDKTISRIDFHTFCFALSSTNVTPRSGWELAVDHENQLVTLSKDARVVEIPMNNVKEIHYDVGHQKPVKKATTSRAGAKKAHNKRLASK